MEVWTPSRTRFCGGSYSILRNPEPDSAPGRTCFSAQPEPLSAGISREIHSLVHSTRCESVPDSACRRCRMTCLPPFFAGIARRDTQKLPHQGPAYPFLRAGNPPSVPTSASGLGRPLGLPSRTRFCGVPDSAKDVYVAVYAPPYPFLRSRTDSVYGMPYPFLRRLRQLYGTRKDTKNYYTPAIY